MKIKLSKSQWEGIGKKAGWIKTADVIYTGTPCPKCNSIEHTILNPSHPTINECVKCKHRWNPDNEKAGQVKIAIIKDDGYADGGEPYTDEEMDLMEKTEKRPSFSFGATPEDVIKEKVNKQTPSGYPMTIKSKGEWAVIAEAVNQGIDSHLEGFTRSKFDSKTGKCLIHPEEMTTFLRRLYENDDEESWSLRSAILETLGIEEV